jgi:hypothetical protein
VAGCGTEVLLQAASISADWVGNSAVRLPATKSATGWQGDRRGISAQGKMREEGSWGAAGQCSAEKRTNVVPPHSKHEQAHTTTPTAEHRRQRRRHSLAVVLSSLASDTRWSVPVLKGAYKPCRQAAAASESL